MNEVQNKDYDIWLSSLKAPINGIEESGNYEDISFPYLHNQELAGKDKDKFLAFVNYGTRPSKDIMMSIPDNYSVIDSALVVGKGAFTWLEIAYLLNKAKSQDFPIVFKVSIGNSFYLQMAKIAALQSIAKNYLGQIDFLIASKPAKYNKYPIDQYNNLVRASSEYTSALLSGSDILLPVEYLIRDKEESLRLSKNMIELLMKESKMNYSGNRWAGSTSISYISYRIAEKAWNFLKDRQENTTEEIEHDILNLCREHREVRINQSESVSVIGVNNYIPQEQIDVYSLGSISPIESKFQLNYHSADSIESLLLSYGQTKSNLALLTSDDASPYELRALKNEMKGVDNAMQRNNSIYIMDAPLSDKNISKAIIAGGFDD